MSQDKLIYLFSKYLTNTISKTELNELLWQIEQLDDEMFSDLADFLEDKYQNDNLKERFKREVVFRRIESEIVKGKYKESPKNKIKKWAAIAASLLVILGSGLIWQSFKKGMPIEYVDVNDIQLPTQHDALVSLDDGRTYSLLHTSEGLLREEGIERVISEDGEVSFKIAALKGSKIRQYTFHSPKGTSSSLMLSDGTKVWLNSDASLTYPTQFMEDIRKVSVNGEAYFDVTHNSEKPFVVLTESTEIKVLGTEFNVEAYRENEKTITTLISGSVEIVTSNEKAKLKPGMQSLTSTQSGTIETYEADIAGVLAWKEGYFRFNDDDIESVLDKIRKWYDIKGYEIREYTSDRFTGSVLRTRNLSDLLNQLEKISKYKFEISEGRVWIMK